MVLFMGDMETYINSLKQLLVFLEINKGTWPADPMFNVEDGLRALGRYGEQ